MEGLKFHEVKLAKPFLQTMADEKVLSRTTRDYLQIVFDHGGYIAGGFGTVFARNTLGLDNKRDIFDAVRSYLGDPRVRDPNKSKELFRFTGIGDIDVWFPNMKNLAAFKHSASAAQLYLSESRKIEVGTTVTGADDVIIDRDARIQVINKYVAPLLDQIGRFDIYNGMVAITPQGLVVPEHFETLEREKMLHVATWASPWTINRFFKWMHRKHYVNVTPAVAHHLMAQLEKVVEWKGKYADDLKDLDPKDERIQKLDNLKRFVLTCPNVVQALIAPALRHMTGEQLLMVSAWFRSPLKYDFAMKEIHRRMPPK